jgi:exonuclease III
LNVSGPSLARAERIWDYLVKIDADVLVLTETRGTPGTEALLASFRDAGYTVGAASDLDRGERGVAIVHRLEGATDSIVETVDLSHRIRVTTLEADEPLTVVGVYVPSRDGSPEKINRKRNFLNQLNRVLRRVSHNRNLVLMGDLNIVSRSHEPRYSAFRSWEYDALEEISGCGLADGFLELHPSTQAHSWIGRTGNGYRYDYAFLSASLLDKLNRCEYVHEPRELGLSDHAGMLLTIETSGRVMDMNLA